MTEYQYAAGVLVGIGYIAIMLYGFICYLDYLLEQMARCDSDVDLIMDREGLRQKELGSKTFMA